MPLLPILRISRLVWLLFPVIFMPLTAALLLPFLSSYVVPFHVVVTDWQHSAGTLDLLYRICGRFFTSPGLAVVILCIPEAAHFSQGFHSMPGEQAECDRVTSSCTQPLSIIGLQNVSLYFSNLPQTTGTLPIDKQEPKTRQSCNMPHPHPSMSCSSA